MMRRLALVLLLCATTAPALAGCLFDFDRAATLEPGDVAGRALREPSVPARYASATVPGAGRVYRTRGDGSFAVKGLVPGAFSLDLVDDKNGDGWPERAARRTFTITMAPHADGVFGEGAARPTFVVLGDVLLEGIVEAAGRVAREDGAPVVGARVFALRTVSLPASAGRDALTVELAADAETATDVDGRFGFPALPAGDLSFVALHDEGAALLASEPVTARAAAGDSLDVELRVQVAPPTRRVRVELVPAPAADEALRVHVTVPGANPPLGEGRFDLGDDDVYPGGARLDLEVPVGAWDVWVESERGRYGVLRQQVASPPGRDVLTWGLLLLGSDEPCAGVDGSGRAIRDCDHDALQGLPPIADGSDPLVEVWRSCAPACADAFGEAALAASCEVAGEVYDCDDDGDGQADVTEAFACYGLGRGADPDGDGRCGGDDPYPQCRENDPAHERCRGGGTLVEFPPPIRPELEGGGVDAGPSDGGQDDDAGTDGGLVDAGLVDAGPVDGGPTAFTDGLGQPTVRDMAPFAGGAALLLDAYGVIDLGEGCAAVRRTSYQMVALLDLWGACRWSVVVEEGGGAVDAGAAGAQLEALTVLASGELLVVGTFSGDAVITGPGGTLTRTTTSHDDLLAFVLDESGAPVRAGTGGFSGPAYLSVNDVAPLEGGGFVVAGFTYGGPLTLDVAGAAHTIGNSDFHNDLFLVGYDESFAAQWSFDGTSVDGAVAAAAVTSSGAGDAARAVALLGLDSVATLEQLGTLDAADGGVLVLALDVAPAQAGALAWHRRVAGVFPGDTALASYDGGVVLAASSSQPVTLDDPLGGGTATVTPVGSSALLALYDLDGALSGVRELPARDPDSLVAIHDLALSEGGDLLVAGELHGGFSLFGAAVHDDSGATQAFVTRLDGAAGFGAPVFLQRSYGDEARADRVTPLPDGATLAAGYAGGEVYLGGLRFLAQGGDGEGFLWRIQPDGSSAEHLLLPYGDGCPAAGACGSRRCERPGWATAASGLCTEACDPLSPTCPEASSCWADPDGVTGVCLPAGACTSDAHCDGGRCDPHTLRCEAGCTTRADCGGSEACHVALGVCVTDCGLGGSCQHDEVCTPAAEGFVCQPDCRLYGGSCGADLCGVDGLCSPGEPPSANVYGDTWTWDRASRQWTFVSLASGPGPRARHVMGPSGEGVVLLGGRDHLGEDLEAIPLVFQGGQWLSRSSTVSDLVTGGAAAGDPTTGAGTFWVYAPPALAGTPTFAALPCCNGTLTRVSTQAFPSPSRTDAAVAYDGQAGVWLFGGRDGQAALADLWHFDTAAPTPTWTAVAVTGDAPGARYEHALTWTGAAGTMLLAGGRGPDGGLLDDTWRLHHDVTSGTTTWTELVGAGLGPRAGHGMTWDGGRVLLYGGAASRARPATRDTLEFNEVNNGWAAARARSVPPPPRTRVRMAADATQVVLHGGEVGPTPVQVHDDAFTAAVSAGGLVSWQELPASLAAPVDGAAYTRDPDGALWVFGGRDERGRLSRQLFVYRPGDLVTDLTAPAGGPSAREGASLAFHPVSGELFLFGGRDESGLLNDLWRWDEGTSDFVLVVTTSERPSPRAFTAVAPSDADGDILLFGGEDALGVLGDTWLLSASGDFFHAVAGVTAPSARTEAAVTATAEGVYLFGGFGFDDVGTISTLGDLWIWRGESATPQWSRLFSSTWPAAGGATLSAEPGSVPTRLWLVGGNDGFGALDEVHVVDTAGGVLLETFPVGEAPAARGRHAAGFVDGALHVIGGSDEARDLTELRTAN